MTKYVVKIRPSAIEELGCIVEYIKSAFGSTEIANKLYSRIICAIQSLDILPNRHPHLKSQSEDLKELRTMPMDNYVILYYVDSDEVIVTNILYGASDLESKIKEKDAP